MILLLKTFWKEILALVLVFLACMYLYDKGSTDGYAKAEAKYTQMINEQNIKISDKISNIEANSNILVTESRASNATLTKDVKGILLGVKGKTLTIVKDGGCTPSQTFSDTFNSVNKRVNQSMKDNQK